MTKETKEKLIAVVTLAIDNEDYYTMGKVGMLLSKMFDTNEQLKRIICSDYEYDELKPF